MNKYTEYKINIRFIIGIDEDNPDEVQKIIENQLEILAQNLKTMHKADIWIELEADPT